MNSSADAALAQRDPVAWKPSSFARAIDKSRSWLYALPAELRPRSIKFGRNRLIVESPQNFLRRLAEYQACAARAGE